MVDGQEMPVEAPAVTSPEPVADDNFIRIPRDAIPGGDWHEAMRRSKQYEQLEQDGYVAFAKETGLSGNDLMSQWNEMNNPEPVQEVPVEPQTPQGMTEDRLVAILDEREQKSQTLAEQQRAEAAEQQIEAQGWAAETSAGSEAVKALGFEIEDGKATSVAGKTAEALWNRTVGDIVSADIPDHWNDEKRAAAEKRPASPSQIAAAKKAFADNWADLQTGIVGKAAEGQTKFTETLAGGAGGSPPPKKAEDMSRDELVDHLVPKKK